MLESQISFISLSFVGKDRSDHFAHVSPWSEGQGSAAFANTAKQEPLPTVDRTSILCRRSSPARLTTKSPRPCPSDCFCSPPPHPSKILRPRSHAMHTPPSSPS